MMIYYVFFIIFFIIFTVIYYLFYKFFIVNLLFLHFYVFFWGFIVIFGGFMSFLLGFYFLCIFNFIFISLSWTQFKTHCSFYNEYYKKAPFIIDTKRKFLFFIEESKKTYRFVVTQFCKALGFIKSKINIFFGFRLQWPFEVYIYNNPL